ncbi:MAG TPA: 2-keto-4-pentenoate hydratase [Thermomonas sp.]|nr:2-keto-4-pentenoate hydratase [Thermomonas sp.]
MLGEDTDSWEIARRLVKARLDASALPQYPGTIPQSLDAGYACQDAAIHLWPTSIAGWKVGRIPPEWETRLGEERLVGPIFSNRVQRHAAIPARFPVITGGFAAVEAEFVFVLAQDAPPGKLAWTADEAAALVKALHVGVEFAGSPLPDINRLGPPVVVSDYGNNAGLLLGPEVADWRQRLDDGLDCETFIDGASVGTGGTESIHGGLLAALAFALAKGARRGRPLRAGQLVSTGAATGIHDIVAGQLARVVFPGIAELEVETVKALPGEGA